MQAVVSATGGSGEMRPLDDSQPVYALPLVGTTLIEHTVGQLIDLGVEKIEIRTTDLGVKDLFGAGRDDDEVEYGGITVTLPHRNHREGYTLDDDKGYIWLRGDILYGDDGLEQLVTADGPAMGYHKTGGAGTQGLVNIESGKITDIAIDQEPFTGTYGAYAFKFPADTHEWLYAIDPKAVELAHTYQPEAVEFEDWDWVRYPSDLLRANLRVVESSDGSTYIGDDVTISPDTTILGPAVVLDGANIDNGAVVDRSVLFEGASVGPNAYVGSSILAEDSVVEQGVSTTTTRTDNTNVRLRYEDGERQDTSEVEFGAVLGKRAHARAGSTLTEGCVLNRGTTVGAGEVK